MQVSILLACSRSELFGITVVRGAASGFGTGHSANKLPAKLGFKPLKICTYA